MFRNHINRYLTYKPNGGHPHLKGLCDHIESYIGVQKLKSFEFISREDFKLVGETIRDLALELEFFYGEVEFPEQEKISILLNSIRMASNRIILEAKQKNNNDFDWGPYLDSIWCDLQLQVVTSFVYFPDQDKLATRWEESGKRGGK